ncbi:MAG: hypothetical protein IJ004_05425 [Clostridia bacterium]|nr:hypothetical protein [Clostridia bacterium]
MGSTYTRLDFNKGITNRPGEKNRFAICRNMIYESGVMKKRPGWHCPISLENENGKALPINGLYEYGERIIAHAGTMLFSCNKELTEAKMVGTGLSNSKSTGFLLDNCLYVVGAGGIFVYDGNALKPLSQMESALAPTTYTLGRDQHADKEGSSKEKPNLLTTRRVNTFVGSNCYTALSEVPRFKLDGKLKTGYFELEVRIMLNLTDFPVMEFTTPYVGVDENGEERQEVVIIRYKDENYSENSVIFPSEPIRTVKGEIVSILNENGEPIPWNKLPWGATVKNGELYISYDVNTYERDRANITLTYESTSELDLSQVRLCTPCTRGSGGRTIALTLGDNKIYYSTTKRGKDYMTEDDTVIVGAQGERITSLLEMANGVLGVFTQNGFYRLTLYSDGEDNQVLNSSDRIGTISQSTCICVASDLLTLNSQGIFGTANTSPYFQQIGHFHNRATRLTDVISAFSEEELRGAIAVSHRSKCYLFIGGKVLVGDTNARFTDQGAGGFEYEWYLWEGCSATSALSSGGKLYFGDKRGQVAYFCDAPYDEAVRECSEDKLTLDFKEVEDYTGAIIDTGSRIFYKAKAIYSKHLRLASRGVTYKNDAFVIPRDDLYNSDGSLAIHKGQTIALFDYGERELGRGEIEDVDPLTGELKIGITPTQETVYPLFLYFVRDSFEYDIEKKNTHYKPTENQRPVKIKMEGDARLIIREIKPIDALIKTNVLPLTDDMTPTTLLGAYIGMSTKTRGTVDYSWESDKYKGVRHLKMAEVITFERLDMNTIELSARLERDHYIPSLERQVRRIDIALGSCEPYPLELRGIRIKTFIPSD